MHRRAVGNGVDVVDMRAGAGGADQVAGARRVVADGTQGEAGIGGGLLPADAAQVIGMQAAQGKSFAATPDSSISQEMKAADHGLSQS